MMYGQDYEDALEMVDVSEYHRTWSDDMIQKYIEKHLSIRQYRQEWDEKKKIFRDQPRHDFTSHAADAFRYLAVGLENRTKMSRPPQSVAVNEYNPFTL